MSDYIQVDFESRDELIKYAEKNNIEEVFYDNVYGYTKVIDVLGCCGESSILDSQTVYYYIVAERFDGFKELLYMDDMQMDIRSVDRLNITNRRFRIVNAEFGKLGDITIIPEIEYNPTYCSILNYIMKVLSNTNKEWSRVGLSHLETAKTNMTKQEFEKFKAKLSIAGATWDLVDYNTIAVINPNQNKVYIYTMQKEVISD
jgi:hypothetical protein